MSRVLIYVYNFIVVYLVVYMWRIAIFFGLTLLLSTMYAALASAASGLEVSSSRFALTAKPGDTRSITYTITNNSAQPIEVHLATKQFTADPEAHTLKFITPKYNWIAADTPDIHLQPDEKKQAKFTVSVPNNAASREYHYALVTSTDIVSDEDTKTIQVAPLVYLYVSGKPIDRTSSIATDTRLGVTTSTTIPYLFEVKNKGNIHLESHMNVEMSGPQWHHTNKTLQRIILPEQSRRVTGSVGAPYIPGVYTLTYSSTDDVTGDTVQQSRSIIVIPLWTISALILLVLLAIWLWQHFRQRKN